MKRQIGTRLRLSRELAGFFRAATVSDTELVIFFLFSPEDAVPEGKLSDDRTPDEKLSEDRLLKIVHRKAGTRTERPLRPLPIIKPKRTARPCCRQCQRLPPGLFRISAGRELLRTL